LAEAKLGRWEWVSWRRLGSRSRSRSRRKKRRQSKKRAVGRNGIERSEEEEKTPGHE
jgi:hypothetical protein